MTEAIKVTKVIVADPSKRLRFPVAELALEGEDYDLNKHTIESVAVAEMDGDDAAPPLTQGDFNDYRRFDEDNNVIYSFFPHSGMLEFTPGEETPVTFTAVITLREIPA